MDSRARQIVGSQVEFRVVQCDGQYTVEMYRNNKRFVAFITGLTKELAEHEARKLTDLWQKISPGDIDL